MKEFVIKRTIRLFTLLFAVSFLTFMLVYLSPIDPVRAYIGADMLLISPEQREAIQSYWGLNQSMFLQYKQWLTNLLSGDFGTSLIYRTPVFDVISDRFFSSILLIAIAWVSSGIFGMVFGTLAAMNEGKWLDRFIKGYCYVLLSTPGFWLGLLLLMVFSVWLGIFPTGLSAPIGITGSEVTFMDRLYHAILPAMTLSVVGVSNVCLHTRQKLVDVLRQPHILQARANGLFGMRLFIRHGLRHVMIPAVSVHFASFGELFGGAILAEQVFSYPGLAQAVVDAGLQGDVPLFLAIVVMSAVFVFVGNWLADMLYYLLDPRLRRGEKPS
ncbi:binding-protein-dependent transport system inner membrane protein [Gracilibacillus halophilus YIM-C55.5]|uniref:Binding-protein-dependent transport system inner membrane protein n=1 Tax=Gracilibacillus halophilus YIM-C55.5 TaxID=1308866 RepID=N4WQB0_9BACI|nr:ABC transporter permease [Gracilibacillus halophilus]ENH96640.1 binding-protein-dependent transport system inner membrane protein [Gracilibacillus halophilus YIM-C55.5]